VPEDQIDYDARAADRLTLFSDAVVAIAITLLAIDLPLPHMVSHQLAPDLPQGMAIDLARQSFNLILGFGLSIPVVFVWRNAWALWIVVPLLVSRWRHTAAASGTAGPGRPPVTQRRVTPDAQENNPQPSRARRPTEPRRCHIVVHLTTAMSHRHGCAWRRGWPRAVRV